MKLWNFLVGFILFVFYKKSIDTDKLFKNKRIAIIGAADSALEDENGQYIDGFDFVIRVNKAIVNWNGGNEKCLGKKTDMLFHSFYENVKSGGGPLNIQLFDEHRIKFLINPISAYHGYRVSFNFYKKYLKTYVTYSLKRSLYKSIESTLQGYKPTIGFCALYTALNSDFKELYITGFTFFKTAFMDGYRDDTKQPEQIHRLLKDEGHHNIDLEFTCFKKLLSENSDKNIVMDRALTNIIKAD